MLTIYMCKTAMSLHHNLRVNFNTSPVPVNCGVIFQRIMVIAINLRHNVDFLIINPQLGTHKRFDMKYILNNKLKLLKTPDLSSEFDTYSLSGMCFQ